MPTAVTGPAHRSRPPRSGGAWIDARWSGGGVVRAAAALLVLAALVAGLPAALHALGGFPVPRRVPSWHQITVTFARPDDGALFLGAVRWVSWLAWAAFTVSTMAELVAQVGCRPVPRLPLIGATQALASALVGAVIMGLLPGICQSASAAPSRAGQVVAVPPVLRNPAPAVLAAQRSPSGSASLDNAAGQPTGVRLRAYTVLEGDSLWEIAVSRLGDGERWREIFALNRGRTQPDGYRLTDPDLIYPGWILTLPSRTSPPERARTRGQADGWPARPGCPPQRHPAAPPARSGTPGHGRTPHSPGYPARPPGPRQRPVGIDLPGGGLVGITLAAAISTALVAWRLHRRRIAVPRWPSPPARPEPEVPETIRALRRAHLRSLAADAAEAGGEPWPGGAEPGDTPPGPAGADDDDGLDEFGAPVSGTRQPPVTPASASPRPPGSHPATAVTPPLPVAGSPSAAMAADLGAAVRAGRRIGRTARPLPAGTVVFGTRGNAEVLLTDVARPALALTGPGSRATARALMVGLLAAGGAGPRAQVVIAAADLRALTGNSHQADVIPGVAAGLPDGLTVAASLPAALDLIETEISRHQRARDSREPSAVDLAPHRLLALITTADRHSAARVRAVLEAESGTTIIGILLGHWPAGNNCVIGADGIVLDATGPGLVGVQACHLPAAATTAMLTLLRGAQGHLAPEQPAQARPPGGHPGASRGPEPGTSPARDVRQDASADGSGQAGGRDGRTIRKPGPGQVPAPHPASQDRPQPPGPRGSPGERLPVPGSDRAARPPETAPLAAHEAGKRAAISVLGPLRITAGGSELTGGLRKARELLAYLAVHPNGASGERISADLWPESTPRHAVAQRTLALRKAREMLRTATARPAARFITLTGDRYRLNPAFIDVDLWQFDTALGRAQTATSEDGQLTALWQAAGLYRGPLADGAGYDWVEDHAEHARRRAVDTLARIAAILQPREPEQALHALETAIAHDPYNEAVYQQIMRIQARIGRPDAAHRTLALLQTRLASLGLTPDPASLRVAGTSPVDLPRQHLPPLRRGTPRRQPR